MSTDGNQKTNNNANMSNNGPVTGVPNKTKVVTIKGNQIPQQGVQQQVPNQTGGGPEGAAVQDNKALGQAVVQPPNTGGASGTVIGQQGQPQTVDPDDIDIGKFIAESTTEIKTMDEKTKARKERVEYLTKAITSINKFERIIFSNSETGEFVGTKLQYVKDDDGKSVYDYMNDSIVQEHLEFIVPEGDPSDGSPVDQQVTLYLKKPTF